MEEEKLGCFGTTWNLVWFVYLILSILFAWWTFNLSEEPYLLRMGAVFAITTSAIGTVYQVSKKKPDGFLNAIKHEFFIIRKSISGAAIWIVNRNREDLVEVTQQQTEEIKSELDSGFKLLKNDGLVEQKSIERTDDEIAEFDLQTLVTLWNYLKYDNIYFLLQGYADCHVSHDLIGEMDQYQAARMYPRFHLYDEELEEMLTIFDESLDSTLVRGSNLYSPPKTGDGSFYVPSFYHAPKFSDWYVKAFKEYEDFRDNYLKSTMKVYQELITELKRRRIYHKLEK